nr:MAG TPA: hypothetical protein [Microviridae sp.]
MTFKAKFFYEIRRFDNNGDTHIVPSSARSKLLHSKGELI